MEKRSQRKKVRADGLAWTVRKYPAAPLAMMGPMAKATTKG